MHMTIIRIRLRPQATEYDIKYKYMHNTGTVSQAILSEAVQQIPHTWFIWIVHSIVHSKSVFQSSN